MDTMLGIILAVSVLIIVPIIIYLIYRFSKIYFFQPGFTAFLILLVVVNSLAVLAIVAQQSQPTPNNGYSCDKVAVCGNNEGVENCYEVFVKSWYSEVTCACKEGFSTTNEDCIKQYSGDVKESCKVDQCLPIPTTTTTTTPKSTTKTTDPNTSDPNANLTAPLVTPTEGILTTISKIPNNDTEPIEN